MTDWRAELEKRGLIESTSPIMYWAFGEFERLNIAADMLLLMELPASATDLPVAAVVDVVGPPDPSPTCATCRWFDTWDADAGWLPSGGYCRRYPPVVLIDKDGGVTYELPLMDGIDFCGEHAAKEPA